MKWHYFCSTEQGCLKLFTNLQLKKLFVTETNEAVIAQWVSRKFVTETNEAVIAQWVSRKFETEPNREDNFASEPNKENVSKEKEEKRK